MKWWKILLMLLAALLLLGAYHWFWGDLPALFEDKVEANPVSGRTTAVVFSGTDASGPVWVVTDERAIDRLQSSYRWTHRHMICCLEGTVEGYADFYEGNAWQQTDLRMKRYAEDDVPYANAAFRRAMTAARKVALPMYRTACWADLPSRAAEVEAALPGCMAAVGNHRTNQGLEMHILTPEPLTAEELSLLRGMEGVRVP